MTAMIGLPLALLIGLIFGFGWRQSLLAGLVWYAALAWQTADIAQVGKTAFGGKNGLDTVHWWVYWLVQPLLLAAAAGLLWIGSRARRRLASRPGSPERPVVVSATTPGTV
ncbi:MAG: hypothetical protein ACR2FU_20230 [Streptosporangiaceae bacterium]